MCATASRACPYLGRCEDPENYYFFPTVDNCCHTGKRPFAIDLPYQARVCLAGDWAACLRYRAARGEEMGDDGLAVPAAAPAERRISTRLIAAALAAGAVVLLVLFALLRSRTWSSPAVLVTSSPAATQVGTGAAEGLTAGPPSGTLVAGATVEVSRTLPPPTSSPTLAASATRTPTRTPSPTSTPAPTATATRRPTRTPRPTLTLTLPPSQTPAPSATPAPTASPTPRPTSRPTATGTPLPAPLLLAPIDGQALSHDSDIVLSWQPLAGLPASGQYVVTVSYIHLGATWYDKVPWTRETSWTLSDHSYLLDLSDDGWFQWSVQAMLQTGVDSQGDPVGVALSPPSEVWSLRWMRATDGGPSSPATPTVPPP